MSPSALSVTPAEGDQRASSLTAAVVQKKLANGTSKLSPLDASKLIFTPNPSPIEVPAIDDPARNAGNFCTDHMVTVMWNSTTGWAAPELKAYGPLSIMPTASVLHYATECFEGMKAYRGYDGKLRLFRPDCNSRRMLISAARIALPVFDPEEMEKLTFALMAVDGAKFLPKSQPGKFLYLRPTMIGTQPLVGVQVPKEAMLYIFAAYLPDISEKKGGIKLLASENDSVRAWPGGFGFAKVGANYGPTFIAGAEAKARGYDQVLWLFGKEGLVTEAGASNFMIVCRSKEGKLQLITAPLGSKMILDGVTRRSVLQLARERLADGKFLEPLEVVERNFTMDEVLEASNEGRLVEALACGTAYFVAPVSKINYKGQDIDIPMARGDSGDYAAVIKNWMKNIIYGKEQHAWGVVVEEREA